MCSLLDAEKNGFDISNAFSSKGIRNFDDVSSCEISSCNENYELNSELKSCTPILCTMDNISLTNLTSVQGDLVNGCFATSCSVGYFLDGEVCSALQCDPEFQYVDGNVCSDYDIQNPSVNFDSSITNSLINKINIGQTVKAKEIEIFSDATCLLSVKRELLSSFDMNVNSGLIDGTHSVYVKYHNGSKSSNCLSSSIILDRTPPAIGLNYPNISSTIAGNSLVITGSCSDLNPNSFPINIKIGAIEQQTTCTFGVFSSSFDITSLATAEQTININAVDSVGNSTSISRKFERILCTVYQDTVVNDCVDKDITNAGVNNQEFTNNLNTVPLSLTGENVQSVEIHSDNTCSSFLTEYPFSNNITHDFGELNNEIVNFSVKFKNGTKSECINSSFVYDNVSPSISSITTNAEDINESKLFIKDNSLILNGSCNDLLSPNKISITLTNGAFTDTKEIDCNGNFSESFDITNVPSVGDNSFSYSISTTDKAGNEATATSELNVRKGKELTISINNSNPTYGIIKYTYRGEEKTCSTTSCSITTYNRVPFSLYYELLYNGKFISTTKPECSTENEACEFSFEEDDSIGFVFEPDRYLEARDDEYSTVQDEVFYITASELGVNDQSLVGAQFSVVGVSNPIGGTVSLVGQNVVFTPNVKTGNEAGFNYTIRDTANRTETAFVKINITPLLELQALIFDDASEINSLIQFPPVSFQTIFNEWGRFEVQTSLGVDLFYENSSAMNADGKAVCTGTTSSGGKTVASPIGCTETKSWQYVAASNSVLSSLNSHHLIGFVSPNKYENYEFEVDLTSSSTDDDTIAVVIAFERINNVSYSLMAVRNQGGNSPGDGFGLYYNMNGVGAKILSSISVGGVNKNNPGTGWNNRKSRIKIQRTGDVIRAFASPWDSTVVDESKMLTVNLNSDPLLEKFKGPSKYGYAALSQQNSTFLNSKFRSNTELDPYIIYDVQNNLLWEFVNGSWTSSSANLADNLGYPRTVVNPRNQSTYEIDIDGNITRIE